MNRLLLICISLALLSCSKFESRDSQRVKVKFRTADKASIQKKIQAYNAQMRALATLEFGVQDPIFASEIDCYAVLVDYPEVPSVDSCTDSDSNLISEPNEFFGLFDLGLDGEASILTGAARKFDLVGFTSVSGICPDLLDFDTEESSLSYPVVLGSVTQDITGGTTEIDIDGNISGSFRVEDCNGPIFDAIPEADDPKSLSGLVAWYAPVDNETVFTDTGCTVEASDGQSVACLKDQSGNGNNAIQSVAGSRPIFNRANFDDRNSIDCDGSDDHLDLGSGVQETATGTVFIVFRTTTLGTQMLGTEDAAGGVVFGMDGSGALIQTTNAILATGGTTSLNDGFTHLAMHTWDGSSNTIYLDGILSSDGSNSGAISLSPTLNFFLCARNDSGPAADFYTGDIAEVIIYNRVLSLTEIGEISDYLSDRWDF